ncbi:AEC family transporter [Brevibacterium sp. UMB10442]|nr:AEC family transporter [Brevibacterium sp. UMB10442]
MLGALEGFGVIGCIILAGFLLGRSGVLGSQGQQVLANTVFFVGTPALMFTTIASTPVSQVFTPALFATAGSALLMAVVMFVFTRARGRSLGEATVAGWSVSYVNIGNLGIPIATYVLGSLNAIPPVLLFQIIVLAPIGFAILDATRTVGAEWWRPIIRVFTNPILIGSVAGLLASVTEFKLPAVLADPIAMLGATSVPLTLMAFGISLKDGWTLPQPGTRTQLTVMTFLKLVVHPFVAWLIGGPLLGYSGGELLAIVVTSALPTAQNVYINALKYRQSEVVTRDVVFITTLLSIPAVVLVTVLLA